MSEIDILSIVTASGALGLAAFGIADGLKGLPWPGEAGFRSIRRYLGPIYATLAAAYGRDVDKLLRAMYRGEPEELARIIRQGARVGLTADNAASVADHLGLDDSAEELEVIAAALMAGTELDDTQRNLLGRFELAVDLRVEASLTLARDRYVTCIRMLAASIAIGVAVGVAWWTESGRLGYALIIGLVAVPLAPVAKDVVRAVKSASEALRARG